MLEVKEIFNFIDCRGQSPDKRETGIPLLTAKNIKQGYININPKEYLDENQYKDWIGRGTPKTGDILFTTEAPLGNVAILPYYDKVVVAQRVICLSPKISCDTSYYKWYMLSYIFQNELNKRATGSTALGIRSKELAIISLPYPPLPTQKRIAAILDTADLYRQKTKTLVAKYDQLAKSLFLEMFGDPVRNEKGWQYEKLNNLVTTLGDGLHGTPIYSEKGDYYFINGNNLNNGKIVVFETTKRVDESEFLKYKKVLNETTLLVSINGTLGKVAFYNGEKIILGKSTCYFNTKKNRINSIFLYCLISNSYFLNYAAQNSTGTTIQNVSLKTMRTFPVPVPPFTLQTQFANRIQLIEAQKQQALAALQKSETLFNSLLQKAFKGELDS
ncbi:MAG: restriction endonuclease subunit S [Prolixibacteraceae bacterium]